MLIRLILLAACFSALLPYKGIANDGLSDQLMRIEKDTQQKQQRIERIENKTNQAAQALNRLQKQLVQTAKDVQKLEKSLAQLHGKEAELNAQLSISLSELEATQGRMGVLSSAAYRLERRPAALTLLQPGDRLNNARLASLLQKTMPSLREQAKGAKEQITKIETIRNQIMQHRQESLAMRSQLKNRQERMSSMIVDRKTLLGRGKAYLNQETKQLKALSQQAANLQDLIRSLPVDKGRLSTPQHPLQAIGNLRMPVSGTVSAAFGDRSALGGKRNGMEIEAGGGALVVAPFPGIIRYTGDFLSYTGLVIIEHAGGYHTLLSGLKEMHVVPGQAIVSGEPIGILIDSESHPSRVYFELRKEGQPIDPLRLL